MKKIIFLVSLLFVTLGYSQNLLTNGDFETGVATPWGGNAANPVDDGSGSNFVNQADVQAAGNPWDVSLSQGDLSLVDGETYTLSFDAYTATGTTRDMVVGIGQDSGAFAANTVITSLTDVVTNFSYDLVANYGSAGAMNSRVVFDMGAETGFVFIDNVSLTLVGGSGPTCTDGIQNGDETGVDCGGTSCAPCAAATNLLTNGDFETGTAAPWGGNAANPVDDGSGSNFVNQADIQAAGNPWDVNLAQTVTLAAGETYEFSFVAYTSTGATRSMVAGIGEAADNFDAITENPALTDVPTTFTYQMTVNYNDFANSRVLFDMGAETGFVFIDDVSLTLVGGSGPTCSDGIQNGDETGVDCGGTSCAPCPAAGEILVNGDFETGVATPWGGNAANPVDDGSGSNFVNQADVQAAGNPWDVSLSQGDLSLVDGETYTLSFDAYTATGTTRDMIVGIGQDSGAFAANTVITSLTDVVTNFSYDLEANYGSAGAMNSRVVFDMGAETGFVFIDNVSLTIAAPPAPVQELIEDFEAPAPTVTESNGLGSFNIIADPTGDGRGDVLEVISSDTGESWQQANLILQDNYIDLSSDTTVNVDVYYMAASAKTFLSRIEDPAVDPSFSTAEAQHDGLGWQTLTFDFSTNPDGGQAPGALEYPQISFFPLWAGSGSGTSGVNPNWNAPVAGVTLLIDEVWAIKGSAVAPPGPTCTDGIMNGDETGVDCGGTSCAPCTVLVLPTTAPPAPPARAAADVISIYGTAYGPAVGLNNVPWDDSDFAEETIAGNEVLRIDFMNFLGADFGSVTDASAMTYFHMDYWIADAWTAGQVFNQKLSNHTGGAGETDAGDLTIALPGDGSLNQTWVSLDIPLTEAAGWVNAKGSGIDAREALTQYLITVAGTIDVAFVDNIYLHKNTTLSTDKFDLLGLEAYPNPTNGNWNVKTNKENIETVEVFNMLGKSVLRMTPNASSITIDASRLPSGLYLAKIASKTKSQTIKLVRN